MKSEEPRKNIIRQRKKCPKCNEYIFVLVDRVVWDGEDSDSMNCEVRLEK